jgi:serine/threonine protein kinase
MFWLESMETSILITAVSQYGNSYRGLVFTSTEGKLRIQVAGIQGLEEALESYNVISKEDLPMCISFLRSMLRLKPSDRASAVDLIHHEWLKI